MSTEGSKTKIEIPHSLKFDLEIDNSSKALRDRMKRYVIPHGRSSGFLPNENVVFDLPNSDKIIDPSSMYLSFKLKTTSANAALANAPELKGSCTRLFRSCRVESGNGVLLEDIRDVALLEDIIRKSETPRDVGVYTYQNEGLFSDYKKDSRRDGYRQLTAAHTVLYSHNGGVKSLAAAAGDNKEPTALFSVSDLGVPAAPDTFIGLSEGEAGICNAVLNGKAIPSTQYGRWGFVANATVPTAEADWIAMVAALNANYFNMLTAYGQQVRTAYQSVPIASADIGGSNVGKHGLANGQHYTCRLKSVGFLNVSKLYPLAAGRGLKITLTLQPASQALISHVADNQSYQLDDVRLYYEEISVQPEVQSAIRRALETNGLVLQGESYAMFSQDDSKNNFNGQLNEGLENVMSIMVLKRLQANQNNYQADGYEYIPGVLDPLSDHQHMTTDNLQLEWDGLRYPSNPITTRNNAYGALQELYRQYLMTLSGESDGEMVDTISFENFSKRCHIASFGMDVLFGADYSGISTRENKPVTITFSNVHNDGSADGTSYKVDVVAKHSVIWTFTQNGASVQK